MDGMDGGGRPAAAPARRVVVLVNRRSGLTWSFTAMQRAFDRYWDVPGIDLKYQFTRDPADGADKCRRCVDEGADTVLVVGGDGTVNTIGRCLVGTGTALGVVPVGSGNGFARHFGLSLNPEEAVRQLATAVRRRIDVGVVDGQPFLVTCSMAWDASLVRHFERMPFRGIAPYVFAGVYEFFEYSPQRMTVWLDEGEELRFDDALVFTVANLTQYGGGARIAPQARENDGHLELVVALRQDIPRLLVNIGRFFDGSLRELPEVVFRRFRRLRLERERPGAIQVDGELMEHGASMEVHVEPERLAVLVPPRAAGEQ